MAIRQHVPGCAEVHAETGEGLVYSPGAYVLVIEPAEPVTFARKGIAATPLSGWLVYAGSARGGGGIGARLRRHFRKDKKVHWHVDELTNAAACMAALAIPGGSECEIVDRLLASGLFETALAGFGSSDCRHCEAHLLRLVA
ncbi:DUF123 domain-containing protein [Novosphingobium naphthalenivorans]|uniref:DUF123 domain-containing protein n=1 Tax=Novosphingobium naphthalenivorans TaxID=273168 RepID=UPI0009FFE86C|nr:DUF123 domain-containing protein [Novosphingobium naphthalenivorans]